MILFLLSEFEKKFKLEYLTSLNRELGIQTLSTCADEQKEMLKLAQTMFDTKLPPGVTMMTPFSEESSIKKIAVQVSSD